MDTIIITDLEPDDFIAITILLNSEKYTNIKFVVSACIDLLISYTISIIRRDITLKSYIGKNIPDKAKYLRYFLVNHFHKYTNVEIYLGESNKSIYELPFRVVSDETFKSYKELDFDNKFIICLAPIRELLNVRVKNSSLALYGSYNIRSVILDGIKIDDVYSVLLYESLLATGNKSSIGGTANGGTSEERNVEQLLDIIWTKYLFIGNHITWWNNEIFYECKEICKKNDSKSDIYQRRMKIINNIEVNKRQFVNADTGLIASLLMNDMEPYIVKGSISILSDNYCTKIIPGEGNMKIINCNDDSLYHKQIAFYKNVL